MQFFNGTRIGSFLQTLLYITGVPLQTGDHRTGTATNVGLGLGPSASVATRGLLSLSLGLGGDRGAGNGNLNYTRCYGVLGCIRMKYPRQRGFELFPEEVSIIRPSVCLFVSADRRCQPLEPDEAAVRSLLLGGQSKTDYLHQQQLLAPTPSASTSATSYWITHGYLENGHRAWLHEMVDELLAHDPTANAFVIDWGKGAEPPYTQAATNIEIVGAYVGYLMSLVDELRGLRTSAAHFIGHSLGAHMGGVVGSWLRARGYVLGRISGMDPAQPYFELFPPDARLDASDALFVDVIHTDASPLLHGGTLSGLGTQEPCGHADFYPNAGRDQPGCNDGVVQAIVQEKGSFLYGLRRFFGCNHIRAVEYFLESIRSNNTCAFTAYACESYEALEKGECTVNCSSGTGEGQGNCNRMGFHAKKPRHGPRPFGMAATTVDEVPRQHWRTGDGVEVPVNDSVLYYSMTGTRAPYCREHFTLTLALTPPPGDLSQVIPPGISALTLTIVSVPVPALVTLAPAQGQQPEPSATVLEELTVLEEPPLRAGLGARTHAHTHTFASSPELGHALASGFQLHQGASASLEIRIRPALTSPLSWLAVALGKQYRLGVEWVQLGVLGGVEVKLCHFPGPAVGALNLADPKSQLVLSSSACSTLQPKSMLVNDIES